MRTHLANAAYGMIDYLAYPLGMIVVAPVVLHSLGTERYGVWTVAAAALSTGAVIASGFGDANIRFVAQQSATGDREALLGTIRTALSIHLVLGVATACTGCLLAPWMADRVAGSNPALRLDCTWSLYLASLLMLIRAVETVCVSTQRAFGRYGAAVFASAVCRVLSLLSACMLSSLVHAVVIILVATCFITAAGTWFQILQLKSLLGISRLYPLFDSRAARGLIGFGAFTWLQSVAGLVFGQVDRLIAGAAFGAVAVTSYGFCAQLSQPIYGISAAGLHFLFPYLASRDALRASLAFRRSVWLAFGGNVLFVALALLFLLFFGSEVLRLWAGEAVGRSAAPLLPMVAGSAALAGLNVTGSYAMLALGRVRTVTLLQIAGSIAMLLSARWLLPRFGIEGMGIARLVYGPVTLAVYVPLLILLARMRKSSGARPHAPVYEEA